MILHYDVLEHIADPINFLVHIKNALKPGGKTIFVVPNSSDFIAEQDVSMCIHQHLNYFSKTSLSVLLQRAGFRIDNITLSEKTGTILCMATKLERTNHLKDVELCKELENENKRFFDDLRNIYIKKTEAIEKLFNEKTEGRIGFFVPLRAIPYLANFFDTYKNRISFVDDNIKVNGRFLCDLPFPILSRKEALEEGVEVFVICSRPFGDIIERRLINENGVEKSNVYHMSAL